uniref:Uncharacterized protein n=1 Tax=Salmo trutta TaxID=8032 RepID=A0A673VND1_SALTR
MFLNTVLVVVTDLWAGLLGSAIFRHHFHLLLSGVVLFVPALSLWVSKYSIFANRNHYLLLWWCYHHLLTAGECKPMPATLDGGLNLGQGTSVPGQSLLLLHEGKASCLEAGMLLRGWEVSEDTLLLCLCCLLLAEETAILWPYLAQGGPSGGPTVPALPALCLLAGFPSQLLGGALGYLVWRGLYQGWYQGLLTTTQRAVREMSMTCGGTDQKMYVFR